MTVLDHLLPAHSTPVNVRDDEPSTLPKELLANIVDVLDDAIPNQQPHNDHLLEIRDPTTFQEPRAALPSRNAIPRFQSAHNGPMPPLQHSQRTRFTPWHNSPTFQAPFRLNTTQQQQQQQQQRMPTFVPPLPIDLPRQLRGEPAPLPGNSNQSHLACDSPQLGQLECNTTEIASSTSYASQEVETNNTSSQPNGMPPLTPKRSLEGKRLAIAVSESPTDSKREVHVTSSMGDKQVPDSPGPAFFSFMSEMENSDELQMEDGCFEAQVERMGDFDLLPCLDEEEGKTRTSPPMMPFLSQSPQLSWEGDVPKKAQDPPSNKNGTQDVGKDLKAKMNHRKRAVTLKPKSDLTAFADHGQNGRFPPAPLCQPLFQEQALCFGNDNPGNSLQSPNDIGSGVSTAPVCGYLAPMMSMPPRDDFESTRIELEDRREAAIHGGIFSKRRSPQSQQQNRGTFPAVSQSFSYSPVPPPRTIAPPSHHFSPPRPPVGHLPVGFQSRPGNGMESPRFPVFLQESKGRCAALNHPVPSKFQGDMEKAMSHPLPDFSSLVNFPNSLRQNRSLPSGMRCCVMCGTIRPTCSRSRNRTKTGAPMSKAPFQDFSGVDDFVTIPTQNKGLCTMCDISVWVVRDSGCQIKWCKGCKNFRQWAFFGEKGLATKCGRCRERQREKYAKMKDSKRREAEKRQHMK